MKVKTIHQEMPNKRAAIQFLAKETESNGVIYIELVKLLNGKKLDVGSYTKDKIYQYRNYDATTVCSIERKTNTVGKRYTYIVKVCETVNIGKQLN